MKQQGDLNSPRLYMSQNFYLQQHLRPWRLESSKLLWKSCIFHYSIILAQFWKNNQRRSFQKALFSRHHLKVPVQTTSRYSPSCQVPNLTKIRLQMCRKFEVASGRFSKPRDRISFTQRKFVGCAIMPFARWSWFGWFQIGTKTKRLNLVSYGKVISRVELWRMGITWQLFNWSKYFL